MAHIRSGVGLRRMGYAVTSMAVLAGCATAVPGQAFPAPIPAPPGNRAGVAEVAVADGTEPSVVGLINVGPESFEGIVCGRAVVYEPTGSLARIARDPLPYVTPVLDHGPGFWVLPEINVIDEQEQHFPADSPEGADVVGCRVESRLPTPIDPSTGRPTGLFAVAADEFSGNTGTLLVDPTTVSTAQLRQLQADNPTLTVVDKSVAEACDELEQTARVLSKQINPAVDSVDFRITLPPCTPSDVRALGPSHGQPVAPGTPGGPALAARRRVR